MLLNSLIIAVSIIFSTFFFKKCAGSLHPGKINIINTTFYLFVIQVFLGTALIMIGFDDHYTLNRLIDQDSSIKILILVVMISSVVWPLLMYVFLVIFKVNPEKDFNNYLMKPVLVKNNQYFYYFVSLFAFICIGLLIAYLKEIGYIPLFKLIQQPSDFIFAEERIKINDIYIFNIYIRNLLILQAIPILSYLSFAFILSTKEKRWIILGFVLFVASIITKTYNFEKSPIIFHFAIYTIIYMYYSRGLKFKTAITLIGFGFGLLFLAYSLTSPDVTHNIYNGIFGRLVFSQVGTLTYNFDLFPNIFSFLYGRSFSPTVLKLVGVNPALHLRSARVLIEYYNSTAVYDGIAGVMNSFFVGEAYANFGWVGVVFSEIWTALIISSIFITTLRLRKTPITVVLASYLAMTIPLTTQSGFVDFIYNATLLLVIICLLFLEYLPDLINKFHKIK